MNCALCGRPLPADKRWVLTRWLNPRPPMCGPDPECYQRLRERMGLPRASAEKVASIIRQARR